MHIELNSDKRSTEKLQSIPQKRQGSAAGSPRLMSAGGLTMGSVVEHFIRCAPGFRVTTEPKTLFWL